MVGADAILSGFTEVATLSRGPIPRRGVAMEDLTRIEKGAIALSGETIAWVGKTSQLRREVRLRKGGSRWEFPGGVAVPGLVDAHTHLVFAGDRSGEVRRKLRGESYLDIARRGGGLLGTVRATRAASEMALFKEALARLKRMVRWGTTAIEAKSGYGLRLDTELRMLRVVRKLSGATRATIVPTFLGGHAVPPEFAGRPGKYVRDVVDRQIPAVARQGIARFCDVFCEPGFFSPEQSRRILMAGMAAGLGAKIHAEEFVHSGGARVAADLHAVSADHLLAATADDRERLAASGVTAVLLPTTPFASLAGTRSPGREFVDTGVSVALGSDLSPNSWEEAMPLVMAHAVYSGRLTPSEALTAATVNSAHAIGLTGGGRIVPGGRADVACFDVPSVEHLGYRLSPPMPSAVFLGGVPEVRDPSMLELSLSRQRVR